MRDDHVPLGVVPTVFCILCCISGLAAIPVAVTEGLVDGLALAGAALIWGWLSMVAWEHGHGREISGTGREGK